jgi:hypothetical protein
VVESSASDRVAYRGMLGKGGRGEKGGRRGKMDEEERG